MKKHVTIIRTQWALWVVLCSVLLLSSIPNMANAKPMWETVFVIVYTIFCTIRIRFAPQSSFLPFARYSVGALLAGIVMYIQQVQHNTIPFIVIAPLCVTLSLLFANGWSTNKANIQKNIRIVGIGCATASYTTSQLTDLSWTSSSTLSLGFLCMGGLGLLLLSTEDTTPHERIGSDNIIRVGEYKDTKGHWYYSLMQSSWLELSLKLTLGYFVCCLAFAIAYLLDGEALNVELTWTQALAFSVQTFSTIGYGALYPNSDFAHTLVFIESFAGIGYVAVVTGLLFAKVSHPVSRILFSNQLIFHTFDKKPTLSIRLANTQGTNIVDAKVGLYLLRREVNKEGLELNRIYDLELVRDHSPLFALSWNIFHTIDKQSPLYGMSKKEIEENIIYFIVTLQGHERMYNQQIYDRHTYDKSSLVWDRTFVDVVTRNEHQQVVLKLTHFHDTVESEPFWLSSQE